MTSRATWRPGAGDLIALRRTRRSLAAALITLTCGACASGGGVPRPFPGATVPPQGSRQPPPEPPPQIADTPRRSDPVPETGGPPGATPAAVSTIPTPNTLRAEIVATAIGLRGTPYRNGGSDPSGFDCSGFVQWVFSRHAWPLPRDTDQQYHSGHAIAFDKIQPGDLVFFETVARGASHVGMAIGGDQFIHAPSSRGVVRVESYISSYWSTRFVGARRVLEEEDTQ